jgi:alpha-N-acetylglucosaminidase
MFLTRGGNACAVILVGAQASWLELHAAEELRNYVRSIAAVGLPIVTSLGDARAAVAVGRSETNPLISEACRRGLVELSEDSPGRDGFVIQTIQLPECDLLVLGGSQDRGTLYAAYALLEEALGVGFFRDGERIPRLPTIELKDLHIRERPRFADRLDGSGCMFFYSAMCWNWQDWKRELDWKAKRRANVTYPFFHLGADIVASIMKNWGVRCERPTLPPYCRFHEKALAYARQLGIRVPCHIPLLTVSETLLEKFPNARILSTDWAGFSATRSLHPGDPLFRRFVVDYVRHYAERYGNDHLYYADFLSESRLLEGADSRHGAWLTYAEAMSEALREADSEAVWIVNTWPFDMDSSSPGQSWTVEQIQEYLDAITVPIIVEDLWAEEAEKYKRTHYFGGRPWGFGVLHSFGGHTYLHGDVRDLIARVEEIEAAPEPERCVWFASMPEIVDYNGFYLELAAFLSWNPAKATLDGYIERYRRLRYGDEGGKVFETVFANLVATAYGPRSGSVKFLLDPLYWFRLAPDLYVGPPEYREETLALRRARLAYIPKLRQALETLCGEWHALEGNDMACRDLVDIARQWIAERFNAEIRRAVDAFSLGDADAFERSAAACLGLLDEQARLLAAWPPYHLDVKVERCKAMYGRDACRAVKHAHVWVYAETGLESPDLRDYYRMDLDGLVRDYYRPRAAAYLDLLRKKIALGDTALSKGELEDAYSHIENSFIAAPLEPAPCGETAIAVVRDLLAADSR